MPRKRDETPLVHVGFKADGETQRAINMLVKALPPGTVSPKSWAIRKAIIDSAKRLESWTEPGPLPDRKFWIYGLADPVTNEIRYVGQTRSPSERLAVHVGDALRLNEEDGPQRPKDKWIARLLSADLEPVMVILDEVVIPGDRFNGGRHLDGGHTLPPEVTARERFHIERLLGENASLFNKHLTGTKRS